MKRGRITTAVVTAIAALGLGLGLSLTASAGAATTHAATGAAAATGNRYVAINCANKAQVRPGSYVLTCADYNMGLQGLHWTSWKPQLASGYGTAYENDCKPNCAEGHFRYYPALVVLWGSASVQGHPAERRYTEITLIFTGPRPPVYVVVNGKVVATYPVTQTLPSF